MLNYILIVTGTQVINVFVMGMSIHEAINVKIYKAVLKKTISGVKCQMVVNM